MLKEQQTEKNMPATSAVIYIVKQLGLKMADWSVLNEKDKTELKEYANVEMDVLGIEHT